MSSTAPPTQHAGHATRQLAEFLATTRYDQLPPAIVDRATLTIADTIGVGLAGSQDATVQGLGGRLRPGNTATVLATGLPRGADPVATAVANSVQICSVELDEGVPGGGHPALHVLPAVLAMAEAHGHSGRELIEAFVLGYEAHCRVQAASRLHGEVYPHGNTGTLGTVVGLGRLRGWDGHAMARGLRLAAAFPVATSYAPCLSGASVASALAAVSLPIATMVVDMVESGLDGDERALEDSFGAILGHGFDSGVLVDQLGEDFALARNHLKFHAACGVIHPVLEAAAAALDGGPEPGRYPPFRGGPPQDPDTIDQVCVVADPRAARLDYIAADSPVAGKFSVQFSLATFLVRGELTPASYATGILRDAGIRALEQRIDVATDPDLGPGGTSGDLARVEVRYRDGRTATGTCRGIFGRAGNPSSPEDARAKFMALSSPVLGEDAAQSLFLRIRDLAAWSTVGSLLRPDGDQAATHTPPPVESNQGKDLSWKI
ncbi:MmgE/PrpD family protein [Citricoccus sp. NPDC055426]|uniref:MmgE/PrpD family protein n=1 Tax=Citricoccus sp. NPDC055426 TaxID=3155536 RepID=UPI0034295AAC